jgi:hypothetical protein
VCAGDVDRPPNRRPLRPRPRGRVPVGAGLRPCAQRVSRGPLAAGLWAARRRLVGLRTWGPLLGGPFAGYGNWRGAFVAITALGGLLGFAALFILPADAVSREAIERKVPALRVALICAAGRKPHPQQSGAIHRLTLVCSYFFTPETATHFGGVPANIWPEGQGSVSFAAVEGGAHCVLGADGAEGRAWELVAPELLDEARNCSVRKRCRRLVERVRRLR